MEIITTIILIVFAILQIILFFKIWGMTNDVAELKYYFLNKTRFDDKSKLTHELDLLTDNIKIGSHVIEISTEKQMVVMQITEKEDNVIYICSPNNGITNKEYKRDEIELFSVYWENK